MQQLLQLLPADGSYDGQGDNKVEVNIQVDTSEEKFKLGLDEAYNLTIKKTVWLQHHCSSFSAALF